MAFHRFTDPAYWLGGGAFPGVIFGETYDRVNVTNGGTGGGGSAFADASKVGGPNVGTYFVAFGEEALSLHANRGLRALAENTDYIDNVLHRDVAVPVRTLTGFAVVPVSSVVLPADTYVSSNPAAPLDTLFELTDGQDKELYDETTGTKIEVAGITGAAVGDGFSAGPVTVNFNIAIPAGKSYHVYYGERQNLATLDEDAFTTIKIRSAQEVDSEVQWVIKKIKFDSGSGSTWNNDAATNITQLAWNGLNERYRKSTTGNTSPVSWYPLPSVGLNTAAAGGFVEVDSLPMAARRAVRVPFAGSAGRPDFALGAVWWALCEDELAMGAPEDRLGVSSGFVHLGAAAATQLDRYSETPGLYGFGSFAQRAGPMGSAGGTRRTHLAKEGAFTIVGDVVTSPGGQWFASGGDATAIQVGHDILVMKNGASTEYYNLLVTQILSNTQVRVRYPDGSTPNLNTVLALVAWYAPMFTVSDNASSLMYDVWGDSQVERMGNVGQVHSVLPRNVPTDGQFSKTPCAYFFANEILDTAKALVWGGFNQYGGQHEAYSYLSGDGGGKFYGRVDAYVGIDLGSTSSLVPMLGFELDDVSLAYWTLLLSNYKVAGVSSGSYRVQVTNNRGYSLWNARRGAATWASDGSTSHPATALVLGSGGPYALFKADTTAAWAAWDNNSAAFNVGHKFMALTVTDAVNPNVGDGVFRPITSASGDLQVTFPGAYEGHKVLARSSFTCKSNASGNVRYKLQYRVNAGAWTDIPGSARETYVNGAINGYTCFTEGEASLTGGVLIDVDVRLVAGGTGGAGVEYYFALAPHDIVLVADLLNTGT